MPPLLNSNAVLLCAHGGKYAIVPKGPRPLVGGGPGVLPIDVAPGPPAAGCAFNVSGAPTPCVPVQVVTGMCTKAMHSGMPLLHQGVQIMSATGFPSMPCASAGQAKVQGV